MAYLRCPAVFLRGRSVSADPQPNRPDFAEVSLVFVEDGRPMSVQRRAQLSEARSDDGDLWVALLEFAEIENEAQEVAARVALLLEPVGVHGPVGEVGWIAQ